MSISPLDKEAGEVQKRPFHTRNQLTAGLCAKSATCWLSAFPHTQKRLLAIFLALLLANAQELISLLLLSVLLLNE